MDARRELNSLSLVQTFQRKRDKFELAQDEISFIMVDKLSESVRSFVDRQTGRT
jgi:hypothetical protein